MDVVFTVEIEPKGKKSPQTMPRFNLSTKQIDGLLHGVKNKKTREYEERLATLMVMAMPRRKDLPTLVGPLTLHFLAIHSRPKKVKPELIAWHAERGLPHGPEDRLWCPKAPDLDNLRKSTQDALKSRWRDDSQVVLGMSAKAYGKEGETAKLIIRLTDVLPSVDQIAAAYGLVDRETSTHNDSNRDQTAERG